MSGRRQESIPDVLLDQFAQLVTDRLGIRADGANLRSFLVERTTSTRTKSAAAYVSELQSSLQNDEWALLSRRLTVPETYFFRNEAHWKAFSEHVIPTLARRDDVKKGGLRIWSAGCSTGEEAYTIGMVLAEMGLNKLVPEGAIKATDLVEESLVIGRRGEYRRNSFRGVCSERKERFFHGKGDIRTVDSEIRKTVSFSKLNLADSSAMDWFVDREGPFHVIFCRNVLIYFPPDKCRKLLGRLTSALTDDGTIFAGHAEFPSMWTDVLEPVGVCNTFVWRRRQTGDVGTTQRLIDARRPVAQPKPEVKIDRYSETKNVAREVDVVLATAPTVSPCDLPQPTSTAAPGEEEPDCFWRSVADVIEITRFGQADGALSAAQRLMEHHELAPETHYVQGAALEMSGDRTQAVDAYRKAVFLDAGFAQAHWRLALLLATEGEKKHAVSAARWALQGVARESDLRLRYLSDVDRPELTTMMEHTYAWLQQQKALRTTCASS